VGSNPTPCNRLFQKKPREKPTVFFFTPKETTLEEKESPCGKKTTFGRIARMCEI
jgi:hypothetical protein